MFHMHIHYNVLPWFYFCQISYASSSLVLSDRSLYPRVFRTVPSDEVLAPALASVMNYYQWRRMSIVTESDQQQFVKVSFMDNFNWYNC